MALARKINKAAYDALSDALKAEYKQEGENYVLDLTGDDGFLAVKQEKQQLQDQLTALKTNYNDLQTKHENMLKGAIPKADVEALESSWTTKLNNKTTELQGELDKRDRALERLAVKNVAREIASKISTAPELLIPHIEKRLKAELADGDAVTKVLDATGKPSAMTLDELATEFKGNAAFAAVIIGSKGSGGGATGGQGGGAAKKLSEMSEAEQRELYNKSPDEWRRLRDAEKSK